MCFFFVCLFVVFFFFCFVFFLYFNRICELCNIRLYNASIFVCVNIQNVNIVVFSLEMTIFHRKRHYCMLLSFLHCHLLLFID